LTIKTYIMEQVSQFNFTDKYNKLFIRIKVGKNGWDRFISLDKKKWKKTHSNLSMKEALSIQEDVINNNFKNLFNIITRE
jgi:cell division GTPase FtsZ